MLVEKLREVRPNYIHYNIDDLFVTHGHTVVRLPPYHPTLNPIEEVWGVLKRRVAAENVTQSDKDLIALISKHFAETNASLWYNCCQKTKAAEQNFIANSLNVDREEEITTTEEFEIEATEAAGDVSESEDDNSELQSSSSNGSDSESETTETATEGSETDYDNSFNKNQSTSTDNDDKLMDFEADIPVVQIFKST